MEFSTMSTDTARRPNYEGAQLAGRGFPHGLWGSSHCTPRLYNSAASFDRTEQDRLVSSFRLGPGEKNDPCEPSLKGLHSAFHAACHREVACGNRPSFFCMLSSDRYPVFGLGTGVKSSHAPSRGATRNSTDTNFAMGHSRV